MDIVGMMWTAFKVIGLGCGIVLMLVVLVILIIAFIKLLVAALRGER